MNAAIYRMLAMFCLVTGLGSLCLMAEGPIQVTIPFDFIVGSKSFTAGDYNVRPDLTSTVLAIQSVDGQSAAMALTQSLHAINKPGRTRLVFNRYGDQYFLSQVWMHGSRGRALTPSPAERELIAKTRSAKPVTLVASGTK